MGLHTNAARSTAGFRERVHKPLIVAGGFVVESSAVVGARRGNLASWFPSS